jgi:4-alpha-glucanotransferase
MTKDSPINFSTERTAGILLHISSLPSEFGIGDLGVHARAFVDWMSHAGFTLWQVLPIVPVGEGNSPYCSPTAFGGNPLFLCLHTLVEWKLLAQKDIATPPLFDLNQVEYKGVLAYKMPLLKKAAQNLLANPKHKLFKDFQNYKKKQSYWLEDSALFSVLRERNNNTQWWNWPKELRNRATEALASARKKYATEISETMALQFFFDLQWAALKSYCAKNQIALVGDIPIYVGGDSADVWANPQLFKLGANGTATKVAGCPPDAFSQTGQLWGNPVYNWKEHENTNFSWWISRAKRALEHAHIVRIDHFRGLAAYWEIPAEDTDARGGKWVKGPSHAFFEALQNAFGSLPFIAEDLGYIDEPVIELRDTHNLPGMMILQFAFGSNAANEHLPHNAVRNRIIYTGTHDNETLVGWWNNLSENARTHMRNYLGAHHADTREVAKSMMRSVLASIANHAVLPMQDVLGLDNSARMNTPGTDGSHNWAWRMGHDSLGSHLAKELRALIELYGRRQVRDSQKNIL